MTGEGPANTPQDDLEDRRREMEKTLADRRWDKYLGREKASPIVLATAGLEMIGVVLVLTFLGWWGDVSWGTLPWLTLAGMIIGTVGGMVRLYQRGKPFFQRKDRKA